jgi:hypothetical protein
MWRYWPFHPTRVDRKLRLPSQQPLDACRPRRGYIGALLHVRQRARHGDRFDLERPSFLGYLGRSQRPADTTKARFQFRFSRCMIGGRGEFRLVCILAKTLRPRSNRVVTNNTWRRQNFSWSVKYPLLRNAVRIRNKWYSGRCYRRCNSRGRGQRVFCPVD